MTHSLIELLPWDSQFFGREIGRITKNAFSEEDGIRLGQETQITAVDCLYLLLPALDHLSIRNAERAGFELKDIRMTLGLSLAAVSPAASPRIRPYQSADHEALMKIARESFTHSRFFADSHFPPQRAGEMYQVWLSNCLRDPSAQVLVSQVEGDISGFIAGKQKSAVEAEISLIATAKTARGQGIGLDLVQTLLHDFKTRGLVFVSVVTQGGNVASQALYQRAGFLTRSIELWFHKWFSR